MINIFNDKRTYVVIAIVGIVPVAAITIATNSSSQPNQLHTESNRTTVEIKEDVKTNVVESEQATPVVSASPDNITITNSEGDVRVRVQPQSQNTVQRTVPDIQTEVTVNGQDIPTNQQTTTEVQGNQTTTSHRSSVSIKINNDTSQDENQERSNIDIDNETKIRIRSDSP